jgi:hypothetical protein
MIKKDLFLRTHLVELKPKQVQPNTYCEPKWPEYTLVFDTETTLDPRTQSLLFGFYRVCKLMADKYVCVEEGSFHADDLSDEYLKFIGRYKRDHKSEVASGNYDEELHIYKRADFIEKVFFEAIRTRSLIVAFNAPWDISRISVDYRTARDRDRSWTLIFSQRVSRKTGKLEANPERPCMRVVSKDSKSAFFSLTKPYRPKEWPLYSFGNKSRLVCRVLDLRTLAWALYNEPYSLKGFCKQHKTENQKQDHEPTGTVTAEELAYCRQDVRCTVDALNALKGEFDLHPFADLHPDKAVSPASIGKAYLREMGIKPPMVKFNIPDYILGIASQAYFGGRAECKIRNTPVPVVLTDFSSQYPTINSLLGNPKVLIAEKLIFEDATKEIQKFVDATELDDCFQKKTWEEMKFFALVRPDRDILPARAKYSDDGMTKNIGVNYLTSQEPIWLSGPDVIQAKLLSGKSPHIVKAIRMVSHGIQKGLKATNLRGMVEVDPRKDDLFRMMVEQKQVFKETDAGLSYFLKICANSTSYGMFFEVTPQKQRKPIKAKIYSGEHSHEQYVTTHEKPGEWYFPPIAALITGGARLLLAMLERCVTDKGGQYQFCDTDSLCIVASKMGGAVQCGNETIKALSWNGVAEIAERFASLNCYDKLKVPGSILKVEKVNFHNKKQIELFGYGISAKRYCLFKYDSKGNIVIVDAKAHGLGYLFPPKDVQDEEQDDWLFEAWYWLLQGKIARPRPAPTWFRYPAMMRVTVSTPAVLGKLKGYTKPFNFVLAPILFRDSLSKDDSNLNLIMPFSTHQDEWLDVPALDIDRGTTYPLCLLGQKTDSNQVEVKCYGNILSAYREHPEAKFLGPDGKPCRSETQGLLRRSHIVVGRSRYIGKETSRRWEQGDDKSIIDFQCTEYRDSKVTASEETRAQINEIGIRQIARLCDLDRETVGIIAKGDRVKRNTLAKVAAVLHADEDNAGTVATSK